LGTRWIRTEIQRSLKELTENGCCTPAAYGDLHYITRRGATLARAVREAAAPEGEYRLSHLETHRRMRALLAEEQVRRYHELRGHSKAQPTHKHGH
jgi:hypothetical protein